MADALDQSWSRINPAAAAAAGIRLVSGYLSHDPSKNWTASAIRGYHAHGIGVLLNWESDPGRPLLGRQAGLDDATEAVRQARQLAAGLGYWWNPGTSVVFSCDRDVNAAQWPPIDAYYAATKSVLAASGLANGAYGEADLIDHLHAAGLTTVEFQTLAWSGGRISPEADLYQSSINNTLAGASVDLDEIRHLSTVGAWWPPGSVEAAQSSGTPVTVQPRVTPEANAMTGTFEIVRIVGPTGGAIIACGFGRWKHLEGKTPAETMANLRVAQASRLVVDDGRVVDISADGAVRLKNLYVGS